jgi:probable F420-dependent oxidoreductase
MRHRPFRFGVVVRPKGDIRVWQSEVRHIEDLGYSVLHVSDHFGYPIAPIPALVAAAEASRTLRLGTLVLNNDLRHPTMLAADIASLDVISNGRVELGLGAGWLRADYKTAGLPFDPATTRIERLAEAVQVIKGLFGDEPVSVHGQHYRIEKMDGQPKPVQRPHPTLLIGGGRRQILSLAAREADIVSIHVDLSKANQYSAAHPESLQDTTTSTLVERLGWIRDAAGPRFTALELQLVLFVVDVLANAGLVPDAPSPHAVRGSPEQIADQLRERRERYGISYYVVRELHRDAFAPIVRRLVGH